MGTGDNQTCFFVSPSNGRDDDLGNGFERALAMALVNPTFFQLGWCYPGLRLHANSYSTIERRSNKGSCPHGLLTLTKRQRLSLSRTALAYVTCMLHRFMFALMNTQDLHTHKECILIII